MRKTDDDSSYFLKLAEHVRKKRLTPMLLSSSEGQILLEWEKKGVPLDIAIHTINLAFEKFNKSEKKKKRAKFNLKLCKTLALREWQKFLDQQKDIKPELAEWNERIKSIKAHFDSLIEKIEKLREEEKFIQNIDQIINKVIVLLNSILKEFEHESNIEKYIENLKKTEELFLDMILKNLNRDLIKVGLESTENILESYKGKLNRDTYQKTKQSIYRSWVKKKLKLPNLSLTDNILMEFFA